MEQKTKIVYLQKCKPIDDGKVRELVDKMNNSTDSNTIISQIIELREILFKSCLTTDFDRYSKYLNALLSNSFIKILDKTKDQLSKIFVLSFFSFISFRFASSSITPEQLESLQKQFIDSSNLEQMYFLKILKSQIEMNEQNFFRLIGIWKTKFENSIDKLDEITPDVVLPLLTLSTILSNTRTFFAEKEYFLKTIKYNPEKMKFPNLVSLLILQIKFSYTVLRFEPSNTEVIMALLRLIFKMPSSLHQFTEYTINILYNTFKQENENVMELVSSKFDEFLDFRNITQNNIKYFCFLIQIIYHDMEKKQKIDNNVLVKFYKFISGLLHFKKTKFLQCITSYKSLISLVKFPNNAIQRNSLLSLFIFSFYLGFCDIEKQIASINLRGSKNIFSILLFIGENISQFFDFFIQILKFFLQYSNFINQTFYYSFVSGMDIIDFISFLQTFSKGFIILMKYHDFLIKCSNLSSETKISNIQQHYKMCYQRIQIKKTIEKAFKYYTYSSRRMYDCISLIQINFLYVIWDDFFKQLFEMKDIDELDPQIFKNIMGNTQIFCSAISSLLHYAILKLQKGFNVDYLLDRIINLFEKIIIGQKVIVNVSGLKDQFFLFISTCKDLVHSNKYCVKILRLINAFCSFVDFICPSLQFSSIVIKNNIVFICMNFPKESMKDLIDFIQISAGKNVGILKLTSIIEILINNIDLNPEKILELLKTASKLDKNLFYSNGSLLNLYSTIMSRENNLDNSKYFLKHMTCDQYEDLKYSCGPILNKKTISFIIGKEYFDFDISQLLKALNSTISESINNQFLWDIYFKIVKSLANGAEWTYDKHKIIMNIMDNYLSLFSKEQKIIENNFLKLLSIDSYVIKGHALFALCSCFKNPPINLLLNSLSFITSQNIYDKLVRQLILFIDLRIYSSMHVFIHLCKILTKEIPTDIISPISICLLVHKVSFEMYSQEYILEQKNDKYMHFFELNILPRKNQKLISFCRDLIKESHANINPILKLMKTSGFLFPTLIAIEMICKTDDLETIDLFIKNQVFNNKSFDLWKSIFLGPLLKVFPSLIVKYQDILKSIIQQFNENFSSLNAKQKSYYLVLLNPLITNTEFQYNSEAIYEIAQLFVTNRKLLLKSQAQIILHSLFKSGNKEIQKQILKSFEQKVKSNFLNWSSIQDDVFTYFPMFPNKLVSIAINDLECIKSNICLAQNQSTNQTEFSKTMKSLFNFFSSSETIHFLIENNLYLRAANALIYAFITLSYLRFSIFERYLILFFSTDKNMFLIFLKENINNPISLSCIITLLSNLKMRKFMKSIKSEANLTPTLLMSNEIKSQSKICLGVMLSYLTPKDDKKMICAIVQICSLLIEQFISDFQSFKSFYFIQLIQFLFENDLQQFFQVSFNSLKTNSPLLISFSINLFSSIQKYNIDDLQLEYSNNQEINLRFFELFFITFLQNHQDHIDKTLEFLYNSFPIIIFLSFSNILFERKIITNKLNFEISKIYSRCSTEEEKTKFFEYWGFNATNYNFIEIFKEFTEYFNIYLANEIITACGTLKIPEISESDKIKLSNIYLTTLCKYESYQFPFSFIITIYISNKEIFKSIEDKIWMIIEEKAIIMEKSFKKQNIQSFQSIFSFLIKLIPENATLNERENTLAQILISFINKSLTFTPEENIIKYETLSKLRNGFFSGIIKIAKIFGKQAQFTSYLISLICEIHQKCLVHNNPQELNLLEILLQILSEIVTTLINNINVPQCLNELIDVLLSIGEKSVESQLWPIVFLTLSYLSDSHNFRAKIVEKLENINNDEIIAYSFPILWKYSNETYKTNKLIPFIFNYSKSKSILIDYIFLYIFENPCGNYIYTLLKHFENVSQGASVLENICYINEILFYGIQNSRNDIFLRNKIIKYLDEKANLFFKFKAKQINEEFYELLPRKTKLSYIKYLLNGFKEKLMDELKELKYDYLKKLNNKSLFVSFVLSKIFDQDNILDLVKFFNFLPQKDINYLFLKLKNFKINKEKIDLKIKVKFGLDSILHKSLDDWEYNQDRYKCIFQKCYDQKILNKVLNIIVETQKFQSPQLCYEFYQKELQPIINSMYYISNEKIITFLIINEINRFLKSIQKQQINKKLFSFKLSSTIDPDIHEIYHLIRDKTMKILCQTFGNAFIPESLVKIETLHNRALEESRIIYNTASYYTLSMYEKNLEALINANTTIENIKKVLQINPHHDYLIIKAYSMIQNSKQMLLEIYSPKNLIPFHLSQLFTDLSDPSLLPIIHQAFHVFSDKEGSHNTKYFNEVINHILDFPQSKYILKQQNLENKLVNYIREIESLDVNSEFINKCQKYNESKKIEAGVLYSSKLYPVISPLYESNLLTFSISSYIKKDNSNYINMYLLLTNGIKVPYIITAKEILDIRMAVLNSLLTKLFKVAKESRKLRLSFFPSVKLDEHFYLSQTSSESFSSVFNLNKLIKSIKNSDKVSEKKFKHYQYEYKKEFVNWFINFSSNYALLSALQLSFDCDILNPFELTLNRKNASVIFSSMNKFQSKYEILFRFCGKTITKYLDSSMINGPFVSTALYVINRFITHSPKISFYSNLFFQKKINFKLLDSYSESNEKDEVQEKINKLISKSIECKSLYAIPWI